MRLTSLTLSLTALSLMSSAAAFATSAAEEKSEPTELRAQAMADDLVAVHPKLVDVIFHVAPDTKTAKKLKLKTKNTVIAAHLRKAVGEDSDKDDLGVEQTGKPLVEVQKDQVRIGVLVPLMDSGKKTIGAIGLMYRYKAGESQSEFLKEAEETRDQLAKQIAKSSQLFERVEVPLTAQRKVEIDGAPGKFDFMTFDSSRGRILAAHKEAKTLEILDAKEGHILKSVAVGEAQGVSVDPSLPRYFVGDAAEKKVVVIDANTFATLATVEVEGPVDAVVYNPQNKMVYAAEDDGHRVWVIDPASAKIKSTVEIPGVPEVIEYDAKTDRVYLNIKDTDQLVQINPKTEMVEAKWSTLPAKSPHGLVIDSERGLAMVAGKNGKLVSINLMNGKVESSVEIAPEVDQIAFDAKTRSVYSASKGFVGVSRFENEKLDSEGSVRSPAGAHTIAIDSATKSAWVSYSTPQRSYLQEFAPVEAQK